VEPLVLSCETIQVSMCVWLLLNGFYSTARHWEGGGLQP
jgi:hypothetical protein